MRLSRIVPLAAAACLLTSGSAFARPGGWNEPGWSGPSQSLSSRLQARDRSREGHVEASRFVAQGSAAAALGHGSIAVTSAGDAPSSPLFEAAVVDRLIHAGYDTAATDASSGQVAELRIIRTTLSPAEKKRGPVSGETAIGVSNRGTAYGLALAVDLSKPLSALISTRLEMRIRDRANKAVLWEGRAEVASREGDERWTDQIIAAKLTDALFDGFPRAGETALAAR